MEWHEYANYGSRGESTPLKSIENVNDGDYNYAQCSEMSLYRMNVWVYSAAMDECLLEVV